MKTLLIATAIFFSSTIVSANTMTQDEMEKIIISNVEVIKHKKGYVLFNYKKIEIALISDVKHNRMRFIAPITAYPSLTPTEIKSTMESNFHSALDARYAVSRDVLYSAFIHPLSSLTKNELVRALNQVSTLALTFGSTYTSGDLTFKGATPNSNKKYDLKRKYQKNIMKGSI